MMMMTTMMMMTFMTMQVVVNMSLGFVNKYGEKDTNPQWDAAVNRAAKRFPNMVFVVAAGNSNHK
jgi:C4-dicarboxylate transporter